MGLCFKVRPTHVAEDDSGTNGPEAMVLANARLKSSTLAETVPDALVLGSDTTVAIDGAVLSKPRDLDEAYAMLRKLSGRKHEVYTAVALNWKGGGLEESFVERSEVEFFDLDAARIKEYFDRVDPLDKAGAYGIQEGRELIIKSVSGSVENVMGLPIQRLAGLLKELGMNFSDSKES